MKTFVARTLAGLGILAGTAGVASAQLVINEVDYDMNGAGDSLEYVELYNAGVSAIDASAFTVELLNGSTGTGTVYTTVTLPGVASSGTTMIAAGGFYTIGTTALVGENQTFVAATDAVQNGGADSIRLKNSSGTVIDAFAYEMGGSITYTGPADSYEGNQFRGTDATTTAVAPQVNGLGGSLGRYPDGADTGDNSADFHQMPPTFGTANQGTLALPYTNTFDVVGVLTQSANPPIYNAFVGGAAAAGGHDIVALPAVGAETIPVSPDATSPGSALRVRDISGGGDEWWFGGPGNSGELNVQGYWYLKSTTAHTAETSGITLRNTKSSGFFGNTRSTTSAFGYESGLSLTYTAGTPTSLQGIPATAGAIKLDVHASNPESDTNLASVAMTGNQWVPFRFSLSPANNKLIVYVNGTLIYDGAVPAGTPTNGGVTLGYRQQTGTFTESNGGWFDAITIDTNTLVTGPVSLDAYSVE